MTSMSPAHRNDERIRRGGLDTDSGFVFELTGGDVALELANTVVDRGGDEARELLATYSDLLNWSRQVGLVHPEREKQLLRESRRHPERAARVLRKAIELRETIFALLGEGDVSTGNLERLQAFSDAAMRHRRIAKHGHSVAWQWEPTGLDEMLWPVVYAATTLLTSENRSLVRVCAGLPCRWLFLDLSRRRNRRWCDMTVCGNRAKARRHLEKMRSAR